MKMKTALSTTFSLLMLGATVMASAADMVTKPLRGTVESLSSNTLSFTTRSGAHQTIDLTDKTGIAHASKADFKTVASGSYVGSAATPQPDGTLKALEVTIFAPVMKGMGEGHFGWQNADGSTGTMTNGTVGTIEGTDGRTLTVAYKGAQKKLVVPDDVPVAYIEPAKADELVKGAKIVVFPGPDGKTAGAVVVGKNGFQPPM